MLTYTIYRVNKKLFISLVIVAININNRPINYLQELFSALDIIVSVFFPDASKNLMQSEICLQESSIPLFGFKMRGNITQ